MEDKLSWLDLVCIFLEKFEAFQAEKQQQKTRNYTIQFLHINSISPTAQWSHGVAEGVVLIWSWLHMRRDYDNHCMEALRIRTLWGEGSEIIRLQFPTFRSVLIKPFKLFLKDSCTFWANFTTILTFKRIDCSPHQLK